MKVAVLVVICSIGLGIVIGLASIKPAFGDWIGTLAFFALVCGVLLFPLRPRHSARRQPRMKIY
jgi:hypothetical protein